MQDNEWAVLGKIRFHPARIPYVQHPYVQQGKEQKQTPGRHSRTVWYEGEKSNFG